MLYIWTGSTCLHWIISLGLDLCSFLPGCKLRGVFDFEFIFVQGERNGANFILLVDIKLASAIYWTGYIFPVFAVDIFVKNEVTKTV